MLVIWLHCMMVPIADEETLSYSQVTHTTPALPSLFCLLPGFLISSIRLVPTQILMAHTAVDVERIVGMTFSSLPRLAQLGAFSYGHKVYHVAGKGVEYNVGSGMPMRAV